MKNKCNICCVGKKIIKDLSKLILPIILIVSIIGSIFVLFYIIGFVGNYFYPMSDQTIHYYNVDKIMAYGSIILIILCAIISFVMIVMLILYNIYTYLKDLYYECK